MIFKLIKSLLLRDKDNKIIELEARVKKNEEKIENLTKSIDSLIKFGEEVSYNINVMASHVLIMKASMEDPYFSEQISRKGNSNDDDLIN